jgi:hypothetical protein
VVPNSEVTKQPNMEYTTMAHELRIGLKELLRKAQLEGDAGFLREGVRTLSEAIMEMEVEDHIGAGPPRAYPRTYGPAQWLPPEGLGHEGRGCRTEGSEG